MSSEGTDGMVASRPPRLAAIDTLRGLVMCLMAIDHASEALNRGRFASDSFFWWKVGTPIPSAQFLTRWLTHLCAPTFIALAGTALAISVAGRTARGETTRSIDRHIAIRGALIILFEVAWMSPVMRTPGKFLFQVLYAIGGSLLCMVWLRSLRDRTLFIVALSMAALNEVLVGFFAGAEWLDELPVAMFFSGGSFFDRRLLIAYPVMPWLAIMSLGWVFGRRIVAWGADAVPRATRTLTIFGVSSLALFALVRGANSFGNMRLFRESGDALQWLHVSKYPPSLSYDALELGIASLFLALFFRLGPRKILAPFQLLGQTALFFYLLHLHLLELVAHVANVERKLGLWSAYAGALGVIVVLYPLCAWYRRYKQAHPSSLARFI